MKWGAIIALAPFIVMGIAAALGAGALLVQFVAEAPLVNGGILVFSLWIVLGVFYLHATQ